VRNVQRIFIDFETYYDRDYSLTKMTTIEYVRHEKFKVLGTAIAIDDGEPYWVDGDELPDLDWANSEVIAHNMLFDGLVLTQHYGITAKRWTCTVALARAMLPIKPHTLKNVSAKLGLGAKGDGLTMGAGESDEALIEYAIQDVVLCRGIYNSLYAAFPEDEREIIHLTQRWGIECKLHLDLPRLQVAMLEAINDRADIIEKGGIDEEILLSNKKFAEYLQGEGITLPMKDATGDNHWQKPALSKGDPEFHQCIEDNPDYADVFAARLAAKSNINVKRAQKLINVGNCSPDQRMPMPLKYYGAHTGRWSGTDGFNVQNLPRGSEIRKSIKAPEGHAIVVVDSAQIELRVNAWWSNEYSVLDTVSMEKDADKPWVGDVYISAAANHFKKHPSKITKAERQFGKVIVLGCGYGMGAKKFKSFVATGPLGMDPLKLTDNQAQVVIQSYRAMNANIAATWREMDSFIHLMSFIPEDKSSLRKSVRFFKNHLQLPNGMPIWYPDLDSSEEGGAWSFGHGKHKSFLYGARLQENIVQGLARVIISEQVLAIEKAGIKTVGSTHDEVLGVVKIEAAPESLEKMLAIMRTSPVWAPDLPLDADGGFAIEYSK